MLKFAIEVNNNMNENVLKIINEAIKKFEVYTSSAYGLEARNDGGIDDVKYSYESEELSSENFIIENDKIIGYKYGKYTVEWDGTKEVLIHQWNDTDSSGWNDLVDYGSIKIRLKKVK